MSSNETRNELGVESYPLLMPWIIVILTGSWLLSGLLTSVAHLHNIQWLDFLWYIVVRSHAVSSWRMDIQGKKKNLYLPDPGDLERLHGEPEEEWTHIVRAIFLHFKITSEHMLWQVIRLNMEGKDWLLDDPGRKSRLRIHHMQLLNGKPSLRMSGLLFPS